MIGNTLSRWGQLLGRYGLVVVLAWIGVGKYVKMEARVLIQHSPWMSWLYDIFSVTFVARALGTMEIVAALLIALRPWWPRVSAVGSALAVVLFLGTLSFLVTTPAWSRPMPTAFRCSRRCPASSCSRTWYCSGSRCGRWATR